MPTGGPLLGEERPVNGRSRYFFETVIYRLATDWRAQVSYLLGERYCDLSRYCLRLAVADLLELPDDLPLMPAVTAGSNAKDSRRGKHHDRPLDLSARAS